MGNPEHRARGEIDKLLQAAGWAVQDLKLAHLHAARGVALREFPLDPGHGFDLLLLSREATPDAIVREVLELWDDKKLRFPREQWLKDLAWMRQQGHVPEGFGRPTRSPTDGVTSDLFHQDAPP